MIGNIEQFLDILNRVITEGNSAWSISNIASSSSDTEKHWSIPTKLKEEIEGVLDEHKYGGENDSTQDR
jgi:hypothetical protein